MKLIARNRELDAILALLKSRKHVLLEGSVGVGKTTLALTAAEGMGRKVFRVDGDGRFTEQKLVGSFDPKMALEKGFVAESFLPGPLTLAMREGAVLLINELNRMPESVQNVLLPAMDEGIIQVPYLGEVKANDGFVIIATQNPREFIATSSLSEALLDRMEWVEISPLTESQELEVLMQRVPGKVSDTLRGWLEKTIHLVNLTRTHSKIKRGASIRAAISMADLIVHEFETGNSKLTDARFRELAKSSLANRIELMTGKYSHQSYSDLLDEVIEDLFSSLKDSLKKKS